MGKLTDNQFLFGFAGRINRAKYWYALFASMTFCLVFMAAAAFAISRIFGANIETVQVELLGVFGIPPKFPFSADFGNADPETLALVTRIFYVAATPIAVIGVWFIAATTVKRLHDRNKSGWWILAFLVAPGLLGNIVDRIDEESYVATALALSLAYAAFGLKAWGIVELMFLKGTDEPNRFGPDPLAPIDTKPRWDQQSELKFVPPSAGPPPGPHVMRGT
ncbi:DUF805 domain-containing protein [Bradyrhizobium sp. dw_411]|uniref:DUF805 domain-containing protein n=1 Tax=Bradyrhizobium sp. dw_411 TaxID=2720082 RepID=UPI001BCBC5B3|nr:DUF805 domain-containing protein [Bradyrhizobium sp. dw_411]